MKKFNKFTAAVLTIAMMSTVFCSSTFAADIQTPAQTPTQGNSIDTDYLKSVMDLIKQKYNGNITEEQLVNAAVKGMFGTLDDYSGLYSIDEYNAIYSSLEGLVEGIGVQAQLIEGYVTIMKVFPGSPAQKAGVLSGDRLAQVNGMTMKDKKLEDVIANVKGTAGTKVKLGILRQGIKNLITLEIVREKVDVPSVKYETRGDIGYLLIESFSANTSSGVAEALKLFDDKKITKVVLDLRNNPGGYVEQAIEVARRFVPEGLITKLDYKDETLQDQSYYSTLEKTKYKLAVLVNQNSASAAEILTGAIKDTKAGVIIGTKTFGKAKVQNFTPILSTEAYERLNKNATNKTVNAQAVDNVLDTDVSGMAKMTIALYYTPNGECIDLKGIEPNVKVDQSTESIPVNLVEPLNMTVKPTLGTQYMDVLNTECILKLLKYDVDTPDITLDRKTFAAIKKFQKDSKVYSYGVLDFTTQKLLNKKLDTLKKEKDPVYVKAVVELKK